MRILISGHTGQVAQALQQTLNKHELISLGRADFDLSQPENLREPLRRIRPDLVINAAAYTAVDQAEQEQELAFAINATAAGVMAEECAALGIPLIHYSTDYVFDGSKASPYSENDPTNPLGVYGQSKLAGEQAVRAANGQHLILRTSWVYSQVGKNFLLTMQRLLQERSELRVVGDQVGAPTSARSIAEATRQLIEHWQAGTMQWGTYHFSCSGETSWFGFASAIAEHLKAQGKNCALLTAIPSSDYPTPAQRPLNSRLNCQKLLQDWTVQLPEWREALSQVIGRG